MKAKLFEKIKNISKKAKKCLQFAKKYDIILCVANLATLYTEKYSRGRRGVTRNLVGR